MRAVSVIDPSTTILGYSSPLPVLVSGAALAKLGHPLGEVNITRGCGKTGIIQMVSSNSSCSFAELAQSRISQEQPLFFQLYKYKNDEAAKARIKHVEELGYNAIFLTVDAVVLSNREREIKATPPGEDDLGEDELDLHGAAGARIANNDADMTWEKVEIFVSEQF